MKKGANTNAARTNMLINVIIGVIIALFVAAGVYATYGKLSEGVEQSAILSGEKEPTVRYLAQQANLSIDEYLAKYGLSLGGDIKKNTPESEMIDHMTIENYILYSGNVKSAEEIIEEAGLTGTVTKDTIWKDFIEQAPASYIVGGEDYFNQLKETYGFGDEVTPDMPYGEFEKLVEEADEAADENAEDTAETTETEENTDDGEASETETEAETPAAE